MTKICCVPSASASASSSSKLSIGDYHQLANDVSAAAVDHCFDCIFECGQLAEFFITATRSPNTPPPHMPGCKDEVELQLKRHLPALLAARGILNQEDVIEAASIVTNILHAHRHEHIRSSLLNVPSA